jgi:proteic killer suppression protein
MAIDNFKDRGTADIFHGRVSRYALDTCNRGLWPAAKDALDHLSGAANLGELGTGTGYKVEKLRPYSAERYSIRINRGYRVEFSYDSSMGIASDVQITNHYGD